MRPNSTIMKQLWLLSILVSTLYSCGSALKTTAPAKEAKPPIERVKETSSMLIPIEVSIADLEKKLNKELGNVLYDDNSLENNGGDNLILKVNLRNPIKLSSSGNALKFALPLHLYIKGGWKVEQFGVSLSKYKDVESDINLNFSTSVSVDKDYQLNSKTKFDDYKWVSEPVLSLGLFQMPVGGVLDLFLPKVLERVSKEVDETVKKEVSLKPMIQQAWLQMQEPLLINQEFNTWLKLSPVELSMGPVLLNDKSIRTSIGLKAITETFIGSKPQVNINKAVPALINNTAGQPSFNIGLLANISFEDATSLAKKMVGNQVFEFNNGKKKITVPDIAIYPKGDLMVVALTLAGSMNGKVYLQGKPVYDKATQSIKYSELDFDIDTKNVLVKSANWLAHGQFLKMMEPYFNYKIDDKLKDAKAMADKFLNNYKVNKMVTLVGKVSKLEPDAIYLTEKGIQAIVVAEGKMEVKLSDL